MTWPVLYIFIQRIKSEWELLAEPFLLLSERERSKRQRQCLLKAPDKAHFQIREIPNETVWDQHGDSALPSLPWIQSHLSYREVREVPAEETNQIVMDMKWIHIILMVAAIINLCIHEYLSRRSRAADEGSINNLKHD